MTIRAFSDNEKLIQKAFGAARALAGRLEDIYTDYDEESETCRLTDAATANGGAAVSDPLWRLIVLSDYWTKTSDGAFDASLGSLTRLWRQAKRKQAAPSERDIQERLKLTGWNHVLLDHNRQRVHFDAKGIQLDFGAIAKGYIVDRVFESLVDHGLPCCLVNASGNMRCGSAPPGLQGWRIDVAQLDRHSAPVRSLDLVNQSIATSGDLWQYQIVDGVRRSHILDPATGMGMTGWTSATVLANTAADADACATAICVLGPVRGAALVSKTPNVSALILHRETLEDAVHYRAVNFDAVASSASAW